MSSVKKNVPGQDAVRAWYNERPAYRWIGREPDMKSFMKWGHFTQVVWKKSVRVGVGCAWKGNKMVVVANYDPPGNYRGQYRVNV